MITFITCTMNAKDAIWQCLNSIKEFPVILVDKDSTDGTLKIARAFPNVKIIHQKNKGLAAARNLGLEYVDTEFVCMWGADNQLIHSHEVYRIIRRMNQKEWVGAAFRTNVLGNNYLDKCLKIWWMKKFTYGEREVIGTPCIYRTEILKKFRYDEKCTHSDDSDLGARLKSAGYKQGYSEMFCYDISKNNMESIIERQLRYGKSDKEYYQKYSKDWTLRRKIKSWLHPIKSNWVSNIYYFPFFVLSTIIRYAGWINAKI